VMERTDARAAAVERASLDLVESVLLRNRVGETFRAVVLDNSESGVSMQLMDPPVVARLSRGAARKGAVAGTTVTVRLAEVDVAKRQLSFRLVDD
jgi:exoribonuclease R